MLLANLVDSFLFAFREPVNRKESTLKLHQMVFEVKLKLVFRVLAISLCDSDARIESTLQLPEKM